MGKYHQGCTINFMKPGLLLILAILACVARGRKREREGEFNHHHTCERDNSRPIQRPPNL